MAIDFTKPTTTDNYSTAFTQNIQGNQNALAQWLDSTNTTITGTPPTFAKRFNRTTGLIEEYSGSVWAALTPFNYLQITSAGTQSVSGTVTFTGTPNVPTATAGTNTTQAASTAFVAASFAPLASPALTGTATAVNFTTSGTLTINGTVAGSGLSTYLGTYLAAPGAIGVTTPAGARFTFAYTAPVAVTFSATAMAIDCSLSNVFTTTFTAAVTVAPTLSNLKDGQTINWFITQDTTGTRTMTWPTSFKWPGGSAGVLSTAANAVDLLVATYRAATGFWYCSLSRAFA